MNVKHVSLAFILSMGVHTILSSSISNEIGFAIGVGDLDAVKDLINNNPVSISTMKIQGKPPVIRALEVYNNLRITDTDTERRERIQNIILFLLENGADINAQDSDLNTALHKAVKYSRSPEMVGILLEHGADPSIKNDEGLTASAIAVEEGDKEIKDLFNRHKMQSGLSQVRARPKDNKDFFFSSK